MLNGGNPLLPDTRLSEGKENEKKATIIELHSIDYGSRGICRIWPLTAQQGKSAAKPLITVLNPAIASKMVDRVPLSLDWIRSREKRFTWSTSAGAALKLPTVYLKKFKPGLHRTSQPENCH